MKHLVGGSVASQKWRTRHEPNVMRFIVKAAFCQYDQQMQIISKNDSENHAY